MSDEVCTEPGCVRYASRYGLCGAHLTDRKVFAMRDAERDDRVREQQRESAKSPEYRKDRWV